MLKVSVPTVDRFDPSAFGFVAAAAREGSNKRWLGAEALWEDYSFAYYAEHAGPNDAPLSRGQFFRQLKNAGVKRSRTGAKDQLGKRPYVYELVTRGGPRKNMGRSWDARPRNVAR